MASSPDTQLRQEVMLNQFVNVTGCEPEQGRCLLEQCSWNYQIALSMFFQECPAPSQQRCRATSTESCFAPSNTPATPPNFPDAVFLFDALTVGNGANSAQNTVNANANAFQFGVQPQFKTPNRPSSNTPFVNMQMAPNSASPQDLAAQMDYRTAPS